MRRWYVARGAKCANLLKNPEPAHFSWITQGAKIRGLAIRIWPGRAWRVYAVLDADYTP